MANNGESSILLLKDQLIKSGIATKLTISGCSDSDIKEIESKNGINLPEDYKYFLKHMGKSCGEFLRGSDFLYPKCLELKDEAFYLLKQSGATYQLSNEDYVFMCHQGYVFLFFNCTQSNSLIYRYVEDDDAPEIVASSFVDWLRNTISEEIEER